MTTVEAPPAPRVIISPRRPHRSWGPSRTSAGVAAVALAGGLLWAWSLRDVRLDAASRWGLLPALPWTWYVALAATVLAYVAVLVSRRPVGHVLALLQVVLVAVLFGTTSALSPVPWSPATYPHVGEVQFLLAHGGVDRTLDLWQNFPGSSYLAAGLHVLTGIPVEGIARWAPPVAALATALAVSWAVGGLTRSRRIRYGAVLVVTLGSWVGSASFSPLALAFPLSLVVLGGVLRSVPRGAAGARWPALGRLLGAVDDADLPRPSPYWTSWRGTVTVVVLFAAVVVSHPLAPIVLLVQVSAVCLLLRPARPWLALVLLVVEEAWLLQAWPFLFSTQHLFDLAVDDVAVPGRTAAAWAAPLLVGLVGLLAAAAAVAGVARRRAGRVVVPAVLAAVPVVVVLVQPAGSAELPGAYLFALPFGAFLVSAELFGRRTAPGRRWPVLPAVVLLLAAALELPALLAGEPAGGVAPSDVAAGSWFEQQTRAGATLLPFTAGFPSRSTAGFADHRPPADQPIPVVTDTGGAAVADPARLLDLTAAACRDTAGVGPVYLAVGPFAEHAVRLGGTVDPAVYRSYVLDLYADGRFSRVFADGSSELFRCR